MQFLNTSKSLSFILGSLVLVLSFQNCAKAKFDTELASSELKSASAGDDASLAIPVAGDDINAPTATPTPKPATTPKTSTNTTTTTTTTTGGGAPCPNMTTSTAPRVNINVSSGNNMQSNNFSMKAAEPVSREASGKCAKVDMADVKIMLEQLVIKQGPSETVLASVKGQFLTRDGSITFVAESSVSDVERLSVVLAKSGHQLMSSKSEIKSIALREAGKKRLSLALSQKSSFVKGQSYTLKLSVSDDSALVEDGAQCLLKPVLEVQ
jgi:hypothetical protein